jgi:hypothetical protein
MDVSSLSCASSVILDWRDAPSLLTAFVEAGAFLLDMDFSEGSISAESNTGSLRALNSLLMANASPSEDLKTVPF